MQLFVEERIDEKLAALFVLRVVDADDRRWKLVSP